MVEQNKNLNCYEGSGDYLAREIEKFNQTLGKFLEDCLISLSVEELKLLANLTEELRQQDSRGKRGRSYRSDFEADMQSALRSDLEDKDS
jgi:hypothetical protein